METMFFENMPLRVGKTVLENGLTVITAETGSMFAHAQLVFRTGGIDDTKHSGLAHLLEHLICKDGTRERHPLIRTLQDRDVNYNARTSLVSTAFFFDGLVEERETMIDTLFQLCFGRTFSDAEVDAERLIVLAEYHEGKRGSVMTRSLDEVLFGLEEPWTFPPIGTEEGIHSIAASDVNERMKRDYRVGNAALIVCGGVKHEAIVEFVASRFMSTNGGRRRPLPPSPTHRVGEFDLHIPDLGLTPSVTVCWNLPDPDLLPHPRDIVLRFLSAEQYGRVYQRLRVELGIAYSIQHLFRPNDRLCGIGVQTTANRFDVVCDEIRSAIDTLASCGLPASEVEAVERKWRIGMRSRRERNKEPSAYEKWANMLPNMWLYDDFRYLPLDAHYVSHEELNEQLRQLASEKWTIIRIHD